MIYTGVITIIFIVYIIVILASGGMVYMGYLQGTSQFYMSIFSAAIICYCLYLDFKKRWNKRKEKESASDSPSRKKSAANPKDKKSSANISRIAHQSTKDKNLKK